MLQGCSTHNDHCQQQPWPQTEQWTLVCWVAVRWTVSVAPGSRGQTGDGSHPSATKPMCNADQKLD